MNKKTKLEDLGLIDYKKCWQYQESLFESIINQKKANRAHGLKNKTNNYLLFCEHPHVYTLGRNGNNNNLLVSSELLTERGAQFYNTNRGGDVTYHGPGQLVCYPILDLDNFFTDINKYLRKLEEAIILTLKPYGINGERSKGETGVWIGVGSQKARKICAIGVKTSRWVTLHGFAFNISTDLTYFKNIIPCGIVGKSVTSLEKELNKSIDKEKIKKEVVAHLINLFEMEII